MNMVFNMYFILVNNNAMLLFFLLEGLKKIGTIKSMLTLAFTPIVGTIIAMAARGDSINSFEAIATGMIAIGTYIISKS
jgi:drug/metabolite transporter (DMT)-like permease